MKKLNTQEAMQINGGKTYYCPFGCKKSGGYWSVYSHCLLKRCFTRDKQLNAIWKAAKFCLSASKLTGGLGKAINLFR